MSFNPLTLEELEYFNEYGFVKQNGMLSESIIQKIEIKIKEFSRENHPGHTLESSTDQYRAFHGCHLYCEYIDLLTKIAPLVESAKCILNDNVYLHQLKINLKSAFTGESWPWHQDYIFWRKEDGLPKDDIVTVMIFLDDIDEFNAPLFLIPKSQRIGCIELNKSKTNKHGWESDVDSDLSYKVPNEIVEEQVKLNNIFSAKGKRGSVYWFHSNIVHGSSANISPYPRKILLLTYNSVRNSPKSDPDRLDRPDFLNGRDRNPLVPINYNLFLSEF